MFGVHRLQYCLHGCGHVHIAVYFFCTLRLIAWRINNKWLAVVDAVLPVSAVIVTADVGCVLILEPKNK